MSKTKEALMQSEQERLQAEESFTRVYKFTNWGQVVDIFGKKAVITSIECDDVKCYYEEGGFDFVNRDDLESEMENINNLK